MVAGVATRYAVVAILIDMHVKLYAGLNQRLGILKRLHEMHVVVGRSVNEQHVAVERIGTLNGVRGITGSVFFIGSEINTIAIKSSFQLPTKVIIPATKSPVLDSGTAMAKKMR